MYSVRKTTKSLLKLIRSQSKNYWRNLSFGSYSKFLFAIFLIFSSIGYLNDIMSGGQFSVSQLIGNVFLSGIVAIVWVYSFTHSFKVLPLAILLFIGSIYFANLWTDVQPTHELQSRLRADSIGILIHLMLGYIFLIQFVMTEGTQQIRLKTEMNLAKDVHDTLVPIIQSKNSEFEIFGKAIPYDEVGGDLVDYYENSKGLSCYIADVSGHGVSAGLLMGMFKTSIHTYLHEDMEISEILKKCNNVLYRLKKRSMFITCAFIRFNKSGSAEYSIAGHLPILHLIAKERKVNQLSIKQIPITAKEEYDYISKSVTVNSGDLLLLLTDGLIEVVNETQEEMGILGIENLLLDNSILPLEELYTKIVSKINEFGRQKDDQTMLIIKRL